MIFRDRVLRGASVAALAVASAIPAMAQSSLPSRFIAPSYQPGSFTFSKPLDVSQFSGAAVPKGAEKLIVKTGDVIVEGDPGLLPEAREALVAAIAHKTLSVSQLFDAARAFERAHADAGYVLVRLVIPPQKLVNGGAVRLQLVNGFIEEVNVAGLPERIREPVRARVEGLRGRGAIKRSDIEEAILLAGDFAGLALRSTLARGAQPGGTLLVLDGAHTPYAGSIALDNRPNQRVGGWAANSSLAVNSALGFGEQFYLAWSGSAERTFVREAPLRTVAFGALVPVGASGLTVTPEFTWAQTFPHPVSGSPMSENDYARGALRFVYPLMRNVDRSVSLRGAFEAIRQVVKQPTLGSVVSFDRYLVGRASIDTQQTLSIGTVSAAVSVAKGLGGRGGDDGLSSGVPLSRDGADPYFNKAGIALQGRLVFGVLAVSSTFRAQYSYNHALLASEQLSLDGSDALSGYPSGAMAVDQGATLRTELAPADDLRIAGGLAVSPYIFGAYGVGIVRWPTSVEAPYRRVSSYGAGARAELGAVVPGTAGTALQLEYARSVANPALTDVNGHRWSASMTLRF